MVISSNLTYTHFNGCFLLVHFSHAPDTTDRYEFIWHANSEENLNSIRQSEPNRVVGLTRQPHHQVKHPQKFKKKCTVLLSL